jgi:hypothetical protein
MQGISIQTVRIVADLSGWFGVSIQLAANLLLIIEDASGEPLGGVTVSFVKDGEPVIYSTGPLNSLYQLEIPFNNTTAITISKPGYTTQVFNVTIATGNFLVVEKTMVLEVDAYRIINRRRR